MVQTLFGPSLLALQVAGIAFYLSSTTYNAEAFFFEQYSVFRDIMAMLLLGFGYLMTFLKSYGLGAVGFTMVLTAVAMQANVALEYAMRAMYRPSDVQWPLEVTMTTLIDAEFAAATMLISFGAVIGRASPLQMLVLTMIQAVFYSLNKVILVFGLIQAEDVGGTITIHLFGAYFGLAASYALGPPTFDDEQQDKVSDIFSLVGTLILWVFWPSFVGATETSNSTNYMLCVTNTVFALLASTAMAFYVSQRYSGGKFNPVHIANSTLAGGVAIGISGRLVTAPGGAIVVGALAGALSVIGYVFSGPMLQDRFLIHDTCGVGNLHGLPSILGVLASLVFIALNPSADFLNHSVGSQIGRQIAAMVATLLVSIVSGYGTGKLMALLKEPEEKASFSDKSWWESGYFDTSMHSSVHNISRHSAMLHASRHRGRVQGAPTSTATTATEPTSTRCDVVDQNVP